MPEPEPEPQPEPQPEPELPELSLSPEAAVRSSGDGDTTTFRFTVTRSGDTTGESSVAWALSGRGRNPVEASDFADGVLPSGTLRFGAGVTSRTFRVQVQVDPESQPTRRFSLSLSDPDGASLGAARANFTIASGNLIGSEGPDQIRGSGRPEFIQGRGGRDELTGGGGADVFSFRHGDSPLGSPDRITDFRFGQDRIAIANPKGKAQPLTGAFSRAANNGTATTLEELAAAVFADADGRQQGNQQLGSRSAALVRATGAEIRGTYLLVNNGNRQLNGSRDLMIELTGFRGELPRLGAIDPDLVFG